MESYLPSITFDFENPFDYAEKYIKATPIPACIYAGVDDVHGWRIYSGKFKLEDLHAAFNKEQFEDIVFDTDLRNKIDAMSLSPVFRKVDIVREFSTFDSQYIGIYLDSFSDFTKVPNKNSYIAQYVTDDYTQKILTRVLNTTSRMHLKAILGIKSDLDPKQIIEESLKQINAKNQIAHADQNDEKIEKWTKLQISIAEKLLKFGAGNKTDLDNLMEALKAKPDFKDPVILTKDQLEIMYQESSKTESE